MKRALTPAVSGHCPCGGTYRWLPREERGFLVPGSATMRCDRCGAERPRVNPRWRYAVEVRYADSEAPWEWWNGSNSGAGAVAVAKRYAKHPDRSVRVREEGTERIVWSTR